MAAKRSKPVFGSASVWRMAVLLALLTGQTTGLAGQRESQAPDPSGVEYAPLSVRDTQRLSDLLSHGLWNGRHPLGDKLLPMGRWLNIAGNPLAARLIIGEALRPAAEGGLDDRAPLKIMSIGHIAGREDLETAIDLISAKRLNNKFMIQAITRVAAQMCDRRVVGSLEILKRVVDFRFWSPVEDKGDVYKTLLFSTMYSREYLKYQALIEQVNEDAMKTIPDVGKFKTQFAELHRRCQELYGKEMDYQLSQRMKMDAKTVWRDYIDAETPRALQALLAEEAQPERAGAKPHKDAAQPAPVREISGTGNLSSASSAFTMAIIEEGVNAFSCLTGMVFSEKYETLVNQVMDNGKPVPEEKKKKGFKGFLEAMQTEKAILAEVKDGRMLETDRYAGFQVNLSLTAKVERVTGDDGVPLPGSEDVTLLFSIPGTSEILRKHIPRIGGRSAEMTVTRQGDLQVYMRRIDGKWYWNPFGW